MSIGENIKRFRLRKNMSQTDLGNQVGVTYRMIQKYEAAEDAPNSVIPSIDMLRKLAKALEVNFYDIVEEEADKEKPFSFEDYFNTVTKKEQRFDLMSESFNQLERDVFYFIFKTIYEDYHMKMQTGMEALDFFNSDSTFPKVIYESVVSNILGFITNNMVKIQLHGLKNQDSSKTYTKEMEKDFDEFSTIYHAYIKFGKENKTKMKDVFINMK